MDQLGTKGDGRYCVVEEESIVQMLLLHCWPYEVRFGDAGKATRLAEEALARWLARGLPHRCRDGQRFFDCCQVMNFRKWTADQHGDPVFEQGAIRTWLRSLAGQVPLDFLTGPTARDLPPRRFVVTLRREFSLPDARPEKLVRLRIPLPYEDPTQQEIVLEQVVASNKTAEVRQLPGRLEVRLARAELSAKEFIEVRMAFTATSPTYLVDPARLQDWDRESEEYQLYTRPVEGLIRITGPVAQLAAELAGHSADPWQAVQAFWAYFFAQLKMGYVHYDELDLADPLGSLLQRGWFDCLTGSALLAALCRSQGIPARLISGILLYHFPTSHNWAEVLLPPYGWVPVDLGSWFLAAGRLDNLPWSRLFLGRLDYRLKTECLPHQVVGSPGIRFPPDWHMVERLTEQGTETAYYGLTTGQLLYRDQLRVEQPVVPS